MNAEQWVELIITRGAELRAVGCQQISVDGASATLLPEYPTHAATSAVPPGPAEKSLLDPFEDPDTFGGVLPGYTFPASPPGAVE
jgi:hypothetical protein